MGGSTKNNMTLEIIGRDPVLTMKIIKMVGERNKKAQRKKEFIQRVKQAICVWS
jgi:c-di-GMP-related signal transduction protein